VNFFQHPDYKNHEQVVFASDPASGLRAIIAIHNTALGSAVGGCRMYPYANEALALTDALRLSSGMTYKAALANLPFGGGKASAFDPLRKSIRRSYICVDFSRRAGGVRLGIGGRDAYP
jgi:leucine dehydrogenase